MLQEIKTRLVAHVTEYMQAKGLSGATMAAKADINSAYLSHILQGKDRVNSTVIADSYYLRLAEATGFEITTSVWKILKDDQFQMMIAEMEYSKLNQAVRVLIGESGCGKTLGINQFCKARPRHTFRVTLHSMIGLNDIIEELMRQMELPVVGTMSKRLTTIKDHVKELRLGGHHPVIVFDEGENVKPKLIGLLKALYDAIHGNCGLAIAGTKKLVEKLNIAKTKDKDGAPQLFRRLKGGIKYLPEIDKTYVGFFEALRIDDKHLMRWLRENCSNKGELADYLEPVLKTAQMKGEAVTFEFFREFHGIKG